MPDEKPLTTRWRVRLDFTIEVDGVHGAPPSMLAQRFRLFIYRALEAAQFTLPVRLLGGARCKVNVVWDKGERLRWAKALNRPVYGSRVEFTDGPPDKPPGPLTVPPTIMQEASPQGDG